MEKIAIVGLSGVYPEAETPEQLFANLLNGRNCIVRYPRSELLKAGVSLELLNSPTYRVFGTRLPHFKEFDNNFFSMTPAEARITDPQHRLFLQCAYQALQISGYDPFHCSKRVGIFACQSDSNYMRNNLMSSGYSSPDNYDYRILVGNSPDFLATRVSYKLNLTGPSMTIQSGCSSSLACLNYAVKSLQANECDMAIVGATSVILPQPSGYIYQRGSTFSESGKVSPFYINADGMIRSSGCSVIVLQRLSDALKEHNYIFCNIEGVGIDNDGKRKIGYMAPSVQGQAEAIRNAFAQTDICPADICYVEMHGTGTALGDPIELRGLSDVYSHRGAYSKLTVGSMKANIGHLDSAAGLTAVVKVALSMQKGVLPKQINYTKPNRHIDLNKSHITISTSNLLLSDSDRYMGVTSLGIGGTNVHCLLSRFNNYASGDHGEMSYVVMDAVNEQYLRQMCSSLAKYVRKNNPVITDVAYTCYRRLGGMSKRVCFATPNSKELANLLEDYVITGTQTPPKNEYVQQWLEGGEKELLLPFIPEGFVLPVPYLHFLGKEMWIEPAAVGSTSHASQKAVVSQKKSILNTVIDVWSKNIGSVVGEDDKFSEICGESLVAVAIASKLSEILHQNIEPSIIQLFDTPRKMSQCINGKKGEDSENFVRLHKSRGAAKAELYMIHPAGGSVFCYQKLFKDFDLPIDVFAIPFPQRNQERCSIQDLASEYSQFIEKNNRGNPIILGGYSFGGNVALAIAPILQKKGVPVNELLFIDSIVPEAYSETNLTDQDYLDHFPDIWGFMTGSGRGDLSGGFHYSSLNQAIDQLRANGKIPDAFVDSAIKRMFSIWKSNHKALCSQKLQPNESSEITLIYASEPLSSDLYSFTKMRPYLPGQWQRYCGVLHPVMVHGNHYSIFSNPIQFRELKSTFCNELNAITMRLTEGVK